MRLKQFRVIGFRSVDDSGWVEVDDVTALVGENESGKTNILLPLWKLNPASSDGEINLLDDFPRDRYHEAYAMDAKDLPVFIQADFKLSSDIIDKVVALTGAPPDEVKIARVQRRYNTNYTVGFPNAKGADKVAGKTMADVLTAESASVATAQAPKPIYEIAKNKIQEALKKAAAEVARIDFLSEDQLVAIRDAVNNVAPSNLSKTSDLVARHAQIVEKLDGLLEQATKEHPGQNAEARKVVLDALPRFVYYSAYGNLDSEIYLPHVIANMKRLANGEHLGQREAAKARTLKVLFEFVKLSPEDILELGQPARRFQNSPAPSEQEIEQAAERTREREVLLTSASTDLTEKFRAWWRQGTHKFRFQADGDHFRIWVSDELRPEEVELEARSSGLQWFFSFFLVFLVERSDEHKDAILLLDEPGVSLHPLAQRDLTHFFENLSFREPIALYFTFAFLARLRQA